MGDKLTSRSAYIRVCSFPSASGRHGCRCWCGYRYGCRFRFGFRRRCGCGCRYWYGYWYDGCGDRRKRKRYIDQHSSSGIHPGRTAAAAEKPQLGIP